jgi:hypothetical protein
MRKLYFVILLAIISSQVDAQAFLKFKYTNYSPLAVVDTNQILTINDSVYNSSHTTSFSGTIFYGANLNGLPFPISDSTFISTLTPLDTGGTPFTGQPALFHLPLDSPAFVNGSNGVIIWPLDRAHNVLGDTVHLIINISYLAGIEEAPLGKIYIIQRNGSLNIQFGDAQNIVQQVSLYNIEGQRIFTGSTDQSRNIPTAGWSSGIYFCEIKTYKGETRTIKFVLQ